MLKILCVQAKTLEQAVGFKGTILETGDKQHEAIALYQKLGYVITSNYGQYSDLETSICMRKEL